MKSTAMMTKVEKALYRCPTFGHTREGMIAPCPIHDRQGKEFKETCWRGKPGRPLIIRDPAGRLVLECKAGCNQDDILAFLRLTRADLG
jgi:hypothetical protein